MIRDRPESTVDYSDRDSWAMFGADEQKEVDTFLVAPTVDVRSEYNMSLSDEDNRHRFYGALRMQRGIYEDSSRIFAPYYHQCSLRVFPMEPEEACPFTGIAYSDVSAAFSYYLEHLNGGRPIILAGFSQGAEMCILLLEEYFGDQSLRDRLVAVYAPGWALTEDMVSSNPHIRPARCSDDVGVVISFDCEAPCVGSTVVNPIGRKAYSINPLNWRTDSVRADRSLNLGARIMRSNGDVKAEIPEFCGCYIDEERGALKVTDVDPKVYRPLIDFFPEGSFHIYDFEFFFHNLRTNVAERIKAFQQRY